MREREKKREGTVSVYDPYMEGYLLLSFSFLLSLQ